MEFYILDLTRKPKIFLLKMIDRLHNLRSLIKSDLNKIRKQVIETEEVLNPAFLECFRKINMRTEKSQRWCTLTTLIDVELSTLKALL